MKSEIAAKKERKQKNHALTMQNKEAYIFLAPWLAGLLVFSIVPMLVSLWLSFTNYNMLSAPSFVGWNNYVTMFTTDTFFLASVKATSIYVFLGVPLQLLVALFLALLLKDKVLGLRLFRSIYYIPSLVGGSVAISIIWKQVFNMHGLFNSFINRFLSTPVEVSWVSNPNTSIYTLVLLILWQFGSPMLIFLAALKQIPQQHYEAAQIEGSGPVSTFFYITLPSISSILLFNLVMQIISAFKAFTSAYIVGDRTGGVLNRMLLYTLHIYNKAFSEYQMGYASALAWVLFIVIALFVFIIFKTSDKWVNYNE